MPSRPLIAALVALVAVIVVAAAGVDLRRFDADLESGAGREAVVKDYEAAVAEGVRSIPTVIVPEIETSCAPDVRAHVAITSARIRDVTPRRRLRVTCRRSPSAAPRPT